MPKVKDSITMQAFVGLVALAIVMWLALFLPAWSLNYWQAWIYWALFLISALLITIYFLKNDKKLIESRVKAGPIAEKEGFQKIIQALASISFILILVIPGLDYHFHWSTVSIYLVIIGDIFVVLGFYIVFLVFKENGYASGTIEVGKKQKVISTGPYGVVRHPMYSGALLMLLFTPIALGSFIGIIFFFPMLIVIILRLLDEEKFLGKNLSGYGKYCQKVNYRLVPYVW